MTNITLPGEKWKRVKLLADLGDDYRLEVSNMGRLRSFHKASDGKLVRGSMIGGYPIIRMKLYNKRDEKKQKYLDGLKQQVFKLQRKIKKQIEAKESKKVIKETMQLLAEAKAKSSAKHAEDMAARVVHQHALVHRLVAEYFLPKPKANHKVVAHLDYNRTNNRVENLKWMTQEEHIEHIKGSPGTIADRQRRKDSMNYRPANARLSIKQVAQMKKLINQEKLPLRKIAEKFGVTETQVLRIKRGINWGDIPAAE